MARDPCWEARDPCWEVARDPWWEDPLVRVAMEGFLNLLMRQTALVCEQIGQRIACLEKRGGKRGGGRKNRRRWRCGEYNRRI